MFHGWGEFLLAFAVFFLSHSLPVRPNVKGRIVRRIGPVGFTLAYSLLSLFVLGWVIVAAGRAPVVLLWGWAPWQNLVPLLGMALASGITALALGRPNPLSFGGARNDRFDPAAPGIVGWVRHPILAALLLWSGAHIVPNGNLAHVILFGSFAGFSLLGMRLIDRRKRRTLGDDWARLAATSRNIQPTAWGMVRLGLAALTYVALLFAHLPVIGVWPLL
ncbi:MAG: NnrU family protein [Rhodobacterales bacterium]|nr:MAG: NnrU family protein [Rhodobacterales bacterium]